MIRLASAYEKYVSYQLSPETKLSAAPEEPVFKKVLEKFYRGVQDPATLRILGL